MKTSVIVATHGRPDSIRRLLASLAPELATGSREIIIAENGTPAPMELSLEGAALKHLHEPRAGKCRIQNRAIAQTAGESEFLVFLDDDLIVAPGADGFPESRKDASNWRITGASGNPVITCN